MGAENRSFIDALAPCTDWSKMGASDHFMQVYEEDAHLLEAVSHFTGAGLAAGDAAVVIATKPHRDHLEDRLRAHGLDLAMARERGQYVPLDAAETLSQIMLGGCLDEKRFVDMVGGVIAQVGAEYPHVRVFGEMVALLLAEGDGDAALQLEEFWNDLAKLHTFLLFCAYPMNGFPRAGHAMTFRQICAEHSQVIPAESYAALASPNERLRTIVQLQQKASALEAEIAQRKELEKALRRREEELADFLENAVEGLQRVGPDGTILWANTALLHLLGYTAEEYIGHHFAAFHVRRDVFDELWAQLQRGAGIHDAPAALRSKDGSSKHVLINSNVLWENGKFVHTRCFIRDITARKQAEQALQQAYAELEQRVQERTAALQEEIAARERTQETLMHREKLAAMGSLLANVAHELNNPLAVVVMQADFLREQAGNGPLAAHAAELSQATARCVEIVHHFLALARQQPPTRARVELNAIIAAAMKLLTYPLRVDTIIVEYHLADDLPVLWADPHQLQQVVLNLVTNAHQALREVTGLRQLTLTTRVDCARQRVILEVSDTGPGIPPAIQQRIFEPFFTTKPVGVGTGLGLPFCLGLVEGHGGTLSVKSASGRGSVFRVELPLQPIPVDVPIPEPARLPATRGKRILLVDDEPGILRALTSLLQRDGHTVETAANGRLALEKCQSRDYELILCDLRMPELDGPGFYQELQRCQPDLCQRVLFLTGDMLSPEAQAFLDQTALPRLNKPFTAAMVRKAILACQEYAPANVH